MQANMDDGTTHSEQPSEQPASATSGAEADLGRRTTMFVIATYGAAIGVILLIVSFILNVYYNELLMSPGIDRYRTLFDIARASHYCGAFGWIAIIISVALAMKGFIAIGLKSSTSIVRSVDLKTALTVTILVLAFLAVAAAASIALYEFQDDLGDTAGEIVTRMYAYFGRLAIAAEGALVLIVVDGLRRAYDGLPTSQER